MFESGDTFSFSFLFFGGEGRGEELSFTALLIEMLMTMHIACTRSLLIATNLSTTVGWPPP